MLHHFNYIDEENYRCQILTLFKQGEDHHAVARQSAMCSAGGSESTTVTSDQCDGTVEHILYAASAEPDAQ